MGHNELKEIILKATQLSNGLVFKDNFVPIDNGRMMRTISLTGPTKITDERTYVYNTSSPSEDDLTRDLMHFITPYLISGILAKSVDHNKI